MQKPIFGYWDIPGLAEPIRFLLNFKNVDFEDKRYSFDGDGRAEWDKDKYSLNFDFPNLPYYIEGNVRLTQSNTILRYLAGKYGLDGNTEEEKLRVSLAEQQISDFRGSLIQLSYNENFERLKPDFVANAPSQLKLISNYLGERKFLAGTSITYADFMAYNAIEFYRFLIPNVLADFPNLKGYQETIRSLPELQSYLASSTYKSWPIFSPAAQFGGNGEKPKQE